MSSDTLFKINKVKKHYPVRGGILKRIKKHVQAVNGVSLDIKEGETLSVVGESGCGKSTLGRAILGLEALTEGQLLYRGQDITGFSRRKLKPYKKEMQMIFQDPFASLNPRQRIGDALEEAFAIHTKMSAKERKEQASALLKEVGLKTSHYYKYPHEFSGGQRQRIGIARAISLNPKFIVCDEAVSALDVSVQAQIIKLLKELQEAHDLTYLFISHDLGVVRHVSDRVLVLYLGHMVELAPVNELYKKPLHPYTRALLSSIPKPIPGRKNNRIRLQGDLPSPTDPPTGCPFHTRCPMAEDICTQERPKWEEVDDSHFVACHFWEQSESASTM